MISDASPLYRMFWRMLKYAQHCVPRRALQSYVDAMGPIFLHSQDLSGVLDARYCNMRDMHQPELLVAVNSMTA